MKIDMEEILKSTTTEKQQLYDEQYKKKITEQEKVLSSKSWGFALSKLMSWTSDEKHLLYREKHLESNINFSIASNNNLNGWSNI